MESRSLWTRFSADPRSHEQVRASDADRAVVSDVLSEAFALGQIDAEEFDERTESAARIKTLGQIPPLLADLVVTDADEIDPLHLDEAGRARALAQLDDDRIPLTPVQIEAAAERYYRDRVHRTLFGLVAGPVGFLTFIWLISSIAGGIHFFWPIFILIPVVFGAISQITGKDEIIRRRKQELTKRARAHLGDEEARRQLDSGVSRQDDDIDDDWTPGLPPRPYPHPFAPGFDSHSRDEERRRRRELRARRREERGY